MRVVMRTCPYIDDNGVFLSVKCSNCGRVYEVRKRIDEEVYDGK